MRPRIAVLESAGLRSNRSALRSSCVALCALSPEALKGPILVPGKDPVRNPGYFHEVLQHHPLELRRVGRRVPPSGGRHDGVTDAIDPYSYYVSRIKMAKYRAFSSSKGSDSGLSWAPGRICLRVAPVAGLSGGRGRNQSGDVILAVEGTPSRNPSCGIEARLSGPDGSASSLRVLRGGDEREVTVRVVRKPYQPLRCPGESSRRSRSSGFRTFQAGVAAASSASSSASPRNLHRHRRRRDSAGGTVEEAVRHPRLSSFRREVRRSPARKCPPDPLDSGAGVWKGKTIVLIDNGSGGSPEVFAGPFTIGRAASLIGEPTAGMAIVPTIPDVLGRCALHDRRRIRHPGRHRAQGRALRPPFASISFPDENPGRSVVPPGRRGRARGRRGKQPR